MSRRPYSYSVLRYVHDIVTGEFVNVGLVFLAPAHDADGPIILFEFKERIQRLRSLFPDIDRAAFVAAISAVQRSAKDVAKQVRGERLFASGDARAIATRMLPHDGSSLQWSDVGTGVAKDVDKEFSRICARMLSSYDLRTEARKTDDDVWRPVRQALADRAINIEFEKKVIQGAVDKIEFKHSWKNGKIHAYEPISFDMADGDNIKDKARRWMGHLAAVRIGAHDEFKASFIVGRPTNQQLMASYETALEILKSAPTEPAVYEESDIEELVNLIEDGYRHHVAS